MGSGNAPGLLEAWRGAGEPAGDPGDRGPQGRGVDLEPEQGVDHDERVGSGVDIGCAGPDCGALQ